MTQQKATGALALLGVAVDSPSSRYSVGHPGFDLRQITAPVAAPVAAAGSAGNLTGDFVWRVAFGAADGTMTNPGPWSSDTFAGTGLNDLTWGGVFTGDTWEVTIDTVATPDKFTWSKNGGTPTTGVAITGLAQTLSDGVTVTFGDTHGHTLADAWTRDEARTLSAKIGSLTVVPTSAHALCDRRVIERGTIVGGVIYPAICGTLYDKSTTVAFSDGVASLDASYVIPSLNMTGANGGLVFLEPNSFDIEPAFSVLPVVALKGTAGKPRNIPGPIKISGTNKADLRLIDLVPFLYAGAGGPTSSAPVAGEPTVVSTWKATTARRTPRTLTLLAYDGSPNVAPTLLYQNVVEEIQFGFSNGKIDDITPKLKGCNYGLSAPAVKVAGSGTWTGSFALLGQRYDASTDAVRIKITQVLANDTVKFKVTRGSGGSYTGAEYTLTVDTSDRQTQAGAQFSDGIELADETGALLGADAGSNRQPLTLLATAPITSGLLVDDVYEFATAMPVPGIGSSPYSGFPAFFQRGPRVTDAHVTLYNGTDFIEAQSGTLTFKFPKREVTALGPGARTVNDMPNEGFFEVDLSITRFLDSTTYRQIMRTDDRVAARIEIEGELIPVNPGSVSTYREAFYVDIPQLVLTNVKAPKSGQVLVVESIAGSGEQPDDPSRDLWEMTLQTRSTYRIPA